MESKVHNNHPNNLRKRNFQNKENDKDSHLGSDNLQPNVAACAKENLLSAPVVILISLLFYASSVLLVHIRMNSFPSPVLSKNDNDTDFTEERARDHLNIITAFGPRVSGSNAHVQAEKYILSELLEIKKNKKSVHDIKIDSQNVNGSFVIDFIGVGEFTSVYSNVKNVIAMLSPSHSVSEHSVLINCHFDTVADSPGASDDAVSCTLMLEILRALTQRDTALTHNVILLFNGAEENVLQASHGFITQHQWADSVKAFINLDSAGAGGWELVFQTGPEHPWLVRAYANSAKYPCGSAFSQEIFQNGLVPSDTDYRVFRDFGDLPGLDIAHVKNGYVYHTMHDKPEMVPSGCLQRGGENLLQLLITLANSPQVVDPGEDKHGNMVFFDFIGYFMVSYPQRVGTLINWSIVAVVILTIGRKISTYPKTNGLPPYVVQVSGAILGVVVTWVCTLIPPVLIALTLYALEREMSWFSNIHNISWLFILPGAAGGITVNLLLKKLVFKKWDHWRVETLFFEANMLLFSSFLAVFTYKDIMSAYIPLLWVMFPTVFRERLCRAFNIVFKENHAAYYIITFVSLFVPAFYTVYMCYIGIHFFIPVMGRIGKVVIPDIPVSIITVLPVCLATGYQAGMVYVSRKMGRICAAMWFLSLVGLSLVVLTPMGFPYTADKEQMSLQRTIIVHIDRRFHNQSLAVTKSDSSLWLISFDSHGPRFMKESSPRAFAEAKPFQCAGAYCGLPYLFPAIPLFDPSDCLSIPAPPMNVTPRLEVLQLRQQTVSSDRIRLHINLSGPDHMTCYIMPRPDVTVTWWSEGSHDPQPAKTNDDLTEPNYFLYYANGNEHNTTWEFSVEFRMSETKNKSDPFVDIAFAGHYLHGKHQKTDHSRKFISELPDWVVATAWASTYDMYTL